MSATSMPAAGGRATVGLVLAVLLFCLGVTLLAAAGERAEAERGAGAYGAAILDGGSSGSWPRQVALPDGGVLTLAAPPRAVVPAAAGCVDLLVPLVDPGRVAALPGQTLQYSSLQDPRGDWARRPRFERYEAETLLAAAPDLVLCHGWQAGGTTERLRAAGVPVVVLDDPVSWAGARAQLRLLGELLGEEARAEAAVAEYEDIVAALCERGAGRSALALSFGSSGGWMAGAETTNDEQLRLVGLTNLAAAEGLVGHRQLTLEGLLERDPDVLVVTPSTRRWLLAEPSLAELAALRGGHVLELPGWLYTATSQHLVDGAVALAAALARADGERAPEAGFAEDAHAGPDAVAPDAEPDAEGAR